MEYHKCKKKGCKTSMSQSSPMYCPDHNELNKKPKVEQKTFILRLIKKEKWDNGFINMDMSWDIPWNELTHVFAYLDRFQVRPKRKKKS